MIKELLTGRLWLRDTGNGKLFRRATLGDVIRFRRIGGIPFDRGPRGLFAADGCWAAFEMVSHVGFDLSPEGGFPHDTKAKLIGVIQF